MPDGAKYFENVTYSTKVCVLSRVMSVHMNQNLCVPSVNFNFNYLRQVNFNFFLVMVDI